MKDRELWIQTFCQNKVDELLQSQGNFLQVGEIVEIKIVIEKGGTTDISSTIHPPGTLSPLEFQDRDIRFLQRSLIDSEQLEINRATWKPRYAEIVHTIIREENAGKTGRQLESISRSCGVVNADRQKIAKSINKVLKQQCLPYRLRQQPDVCPMSHRAIFRFYRIAV